MNHLLDTNACIALMKPEVNPVQTRFLAAMNRGGRFLVSSIVAFELWYGIAKSKRPQENTKRVETFFSGPLELLPFDQEDGKIAGGIRAELQAAGTPIGAYDLLIAGQALRHSLRLITANVSEFSCVRGLDWEDWNK